MTQQQMQMAHSSRCLLADHVGRWRLFRHRKGIDAPCCGTSSAIWEGSSKGPGPRSRRCTNELASVYGWKQRLLAELCNIPQVREEVYSTHLVCSLATEVTCVFVRLRQKGQSIQSGSWASPLSGLTGPALLRSFISTVMMQSTYSLV